MSIYDIPNEVLHKNIFEYLHPVDYVSCISTCRFLYYATDKKQNDRKREIYLNEIQMKRKNEQMKRKNEQIKRKNEFIDNGKGLIKALHIGAEYLTKNIDGVDLTGFSQQDLSGYDKILGELYDNPIYKENEVPIEMKILGMMGMGAFMYHLTH